MVRREVGGVFRSPSWGLREDPKEVERVKGGEKEDAKRQVSHENRAMGAGQLELRAVQMEHGKL